MVHRASGEPLIKGYKKGVRIVFQSYLILRSWRTFSTDKTTAPHRKAYTDSLSGVGKATDVDAIVNSSSWKFKPPSSRIEDKISITPFRWTNVHHQQMLNPVRLSLQPTSLNSVTKIVNVSEISLKFNVKKESDKSRTLCMD